MNDPTPSMTPIPEPIDTGEGLAQQLINRVAELEKRLEQIQAASQAKPSAAGADSTRGKAHRLEADGTKGGVGGKAHRLEADATRGGATRASAMAPGVTADPRVDAVRMARLAAAGDRRALAEYLRMRRQ